MTPSPTPAALLRHVLQTVVGLLGLSPAADMQVSIPRFYLEVWQEQLEAILMLLDDPFRPQAPAVLIAVGALAFGLGVTLGLVLGW